MSETSRPGPPIGKLHEVRGTFASSEQMDQAVKSLTTAGFDRADLSLPEPSPPTPRMTPESGAEAVNTEEDARQVRALESGTAGAVAGMAAAGLTIATGGAAAAAAAAAVAAGAVMGGGTFAVRSAANQAEQQTRDERASTGVLILSVRAPTPEKRAEAEVILRRAGATELATV